MPELAARTLVSVHETTLQRWQQEKPAQYSNLAPPVRSDPVYRPLDPTPVEEQFYRERTDRLRSLPRYRLRAIEEVRDGHLHAHARVATIEDTDRMAVYRGRISAILRGAVDWPDGLLAFAREEIPKKGGRASRDSEATKDAVAGKPPIARVLSRAVIENVAQGMRVDEHVFHRAIDDLQHRVSENLVEMVRECGVEQFAPDYVVVDADEWVIADALAGYGDRTRAAVESAHARSYSDSEACSGTPLHVACAPVELRRLSEQCADACDTAKANESV